MSFWTESDKGETVDSNDPWDFIDHILDDVWRWRYLITAVGATLFTFAVWTVGTL